MNPQLKKSVLIAIFGEYYANKLIRLLSDCCAPHISVNFCATCNGYDNFGNPTYNVAASIAYNMSIPGYTALTYYVSTQPLPNTATPFFSTPANANAAQGLTFNATTTPNALVAAATTSTRNSGTFVVGTITAGVPVVVENITAYNVNPGCYYLMVTDNRGYYSAPLMAKFPNCQ